MVIWAKLVLLRGYMTEWSSNSLIFAWTKLVDVFLLSSVFHLWPWAWYWQLCPPVSPPHRQHCAAWFYCGKLGCPSGSRSWGRAGWLLASCVICPPPSLAPPAPCNTAARSMKPCTRDQMEAASLTHLWKSRTPPTPPTSPPVPPTQGGGGPVYRGLGGYTAWPAYHQGQSMWLKCNNRG